MNELELDSRCAPSMNKPRCRQETELEQIFAVDWEARTYTFSRSDCIMESIRNKLDPNVRISVAD
jgi:hypothetical protein